MAEQIIQENSDITCISQNSILIINLSSYNLFQKGLFIKNWTKMADTEFFSCFSKHKKSRALLEIQGLFPNFWQNQGLSRPWFCLFKIQALSRVFKVRTNPVILIKKGLIFLKQKICTMYIIFQRIYYILYFFYFT